ncbi:MAG TPA: low molecular weight phosphotyrosine protein phosphatase [Candidatus Enterococcus stercoravium]|nr:low molecular weight phosphotyrosine protein phosphatase [Candidatus Enterococcus stercoravium]
MTTRVLFVCLGNICRSPMAEGLMRAYSQGQQLDVEVDSAATSRWEVGSSPHPGTQKVLRAAGVDSSQMQARQITSQDFWKYDYIIGMDQNNVADLQAIAPDGTAEKIHGYMSVVPGKEAAEIPDPWYTGDFEETRQLIMEGLPYWAQIFSNHH